MLAAIGLLGRPQSDITIMTQPASQTLAVGQAVTFSVVATGTPPLGYQWQQNGTSIIGATSDSFTTPPTTIQDGGGQFSVIITNGTGSLTSSVATLTVNPPVAIDVVTYHNDVGRTGQNLNETILTPVTVNAITFGSVGFFPVDGYVDAQPLYLSNVAIPGIGSHDVLYVETEHDSVYAFDATTGQILWHVSVLGDRETPGSIPVPGCFQVFPEIGVTSTPAIDRTRGPNGAMYLIAMSTDDAGNSFQRLHGLDIATGAELFGGPTTIRASYPGTGDNSDGANVIFDASQYKERAGLLLLNGVVYTVWASHCDSGPYTGWVMGFDASTLALTSVLDVTPNGHAGAIWMSGAGLAADAAGRILLLDGNGSFDTTLDARAFPTQGDFGNGFIELSSVGGLSVVDFFALSNTDNESACDVDLGSGGVLVLPDLVDASGNTRHLAVGAGKDSNIYVVDRESMGKFDASGNRIYQEIDVALPDGVYSMPAYFNNMVYYGPFNNAIMAFGITNAHLSTTPSSRTVNAFGYPGATPSISANGTTDAILWAVENDTDTAVLHAYDAANLSNELYNSNQADSGRDTFGPGNKFITPTIANGKVYVGTTNGVAVFGLLR
jgi:hypothetical protein